MGADLVQGSLPAIRVFEKMQNMVLNAQVLRNDEKQVFSRPSKNTIIAGNHPCEQGVFKIVFLEKNQTNVFCAKINGSKHCLWKGFQVLKIILSASKVTYLDKETEFGDSLYCRFAKVTGLPAVLIWTKIHVFMQIP